MNKQENFAVQIDLSPDFLVEQHPGRLSHRPRVVRRYA